MPENSLFSGIKSQNEAEGKSKNYEEQIFIY